MARSMFDSTEPDNCPKSPIGGNSGGILIAYYPYAFSAPTRSEFPSGTIFVTIDQSTSASHPDCDILDVESGCASPSQVPGWLVAHKAATGKQGTVYTNTSTIGSIPTSEPFYWWAAEWTDNAGTEPSGCVACQYASPGAYDASSVFSDSWPPSAAPAPSTTYSVSAHPPGQWKGMVVASGTGAGGTEYHSSSDNGSVWVTPRDTAIPAPQLNSTLEYAVTGTIPGAWKDGTTLTLNGYGTDGNLWRTTTTNGTSWSAPVEVAPPKPWSATDWAYAAPAGLTARGGKTTVFLQWDAVTSTTPAFPAGETMPPVASYSVEIGTTVHTTTATSIQIGSLAGGSHTARVWANGGPVAPPGTNVSFNTSGGGTTTGPTTDLVTAANYGVAHNSQFIYDEIRPVKLPAWNDGDPLPSGTTWTGDCSSFMTLLSKWAGLPDPNGPSYNYNGDGNGASLFSNLPAITQAEAIPGDVVGFGEIHVAMMMQDGTESDPDVASFGEQGDPRIWSLSAVEADTSSDLWFAKLAPR